MGLVLYQALTGRLPFGADLDAKLHQVAPRASAFADVPADLDELCASLLARDPRERPIPREERREVFVGRDAEQQALARWFAEGGSRVVLVRGPSGIGKSALLRRFLGGAQATVLAGRCFELESVPYKALDAVIDELARQLARRPIELPPEIDALATLFPVLR